MGAFKENQREVFARLYDEFMPKVYRYIYYKVNDVPVAEDITADVFEKAMVNFDRYNPDKGAFSTWIFAITRNSMVDYYRRQGKVNTRPVEEVADLIGGGVDPKQNIESRDDIRMLQSCLSGLPEDEQEIIRLKFAMEMSNKDIARALGLSESNVGVKLYRIIRKLKDGFQVE